MTRRPDTAASGLSSAAHREQITPARCPRKTTHYATLTGLLRPAYAHLHPRTRLGAMAENPVCAYQPLTRPPFWWQLQPRTPRPSRSRPGPAPPWLTRSTGPWGGGGLRGTAPLPLGPVLWPPNDLCLYCRPWNIASALGRMLYLQPPAATTCLLSAQAQPEYHARNPPPLPPSLAARNHPLAAPPRPPEQRHDR